MLRKDFPILKKITFLDSASSSLKPKQVVKEIEDFYLNYPLNPHSLDSKLGQKLSKQIEETRTNCAKFINGKSEEIIFTSGTTDAINKLSLMCEQFLNKDSEILISPFNHFSNLIPWIEIAKKTKSKIVFSEKIEDKINRKTKIIAFAQMNNTLSIKLDMEKVYQKAQKVKALVVNDAAQAISHQKVSLDYADVIVFSGNKLYGPTGIGVLAIKSFWLKKLKPVTFGGGSVAKVKNLNVILKKQIDQFEPGTLNTAGIIGLNAAIKYFDLQKVMKDEKKLSNYAFEKLNSLAKVKMYSQKGDLILLFNIENIHSHDVVSFLGTKKIIVRSGNHCANLDESDAFFQKNPHLFLPPTIRVSLAFYNTKKDIDLLCDKIKNNQSFIV